MRKWLAALPFLLIPTAAFAADWYVVFTSEDVRTYVDQSTVKKGEGTLVQAAVITTYKHARPAGGTKFSAQQTFVEYDCGKKMYRTLHYVYYGIDKTVLADQDAVDSDTWKSGTQERTPYGNSLKFACTNTGGDRYTDPFADGFFGKL